MKTLVCTLGGSPPPVVTAIQEEQPDLVIFLCSGNDPVTGAAGSYTQVESIAAAAALPSDHFRVVKIPADDLDGGIRTALQQLQAAPGDYIVADYTGGTKTMSAALALAAMESPHVKLRFTGGARGDLRQVAAGSERGIPMPLKSLRFERELRAALLPWSRFAYDESVLLLSRMEVPGEPELSSRLIRARDLSRAFAAWDRFDHRTARQILERYRATLKGALLDHRTAVAWLAPANEPGDTRGENSGEDRQTPARLFDLWRNAERRAAQGRFDDAVARWYRLTEWLAQWILQRHHGISTSDIQPGQLPVGWILQPNQKGQLQTGLRESWKLLEALAADSAAGRFFTAADGPLHGLLEARNASILAHGFEPIGPEHWERIRIFANDKLLPLLSVEVADMQRVASGRKLPQPWPQLPTDYRMAEQQEETRAAGRN